MADRTRSTNRRATPQQHATTVLRNPIRRNTRSTSSKSNDVSSAERAKTGASNTTAAAGVFLNDKGAASNSRISRVAKRKRDALSEPQENLSIVQEDAGIEYPNLPQSLVGVTARVPRDKLVGQRNDGDQNPTGDLSGFSGSTVRASLSTQDLIELKQVDIPNKPQRKTIRQDNEATAVDKNRLEVGQKHRQSPDTSHISTEQTDVFDKATKVSFNSPKYMLGAVKHLQQGKAGRRVQRPSSKDFSVSSARSLPQGLTSTHRAGSVAKRSSAPESVRTKFAALASIGDARHHMQHDETRPEIDLEQGSELDVLAKGRQALKHKAQHEAESNKETLGRTKSRFIDPQENATRLTFESQESNPSPDQNDKHTNSNAEDARDGGDGERENSAHLSIDDGFEQDDRIIDVGSRRKNKLVGKRLTTDANATHHPSPKKARPLREQNNTTGNRSDSIAPRNLEDTPMPSQIDDYKRANMQAKRVTAEHPKKPQSRKAWTEEEMERLIELIEEYGTSWKFLKECDNNRGGVLQYRDQVALKDKARNMKVDYLKAGRFMPLNFEYVALNRNQTDRLHSFGILYNAATGMLNDNDGDPEISVEE